MKEINPSEKIIDLLSSKNFESLSQSEKSALLTEMDKDEYNQMFELHHQLNSTLQENSYSPTENLKNKLMTAFDTHHATAGNKQNKLRFLYLNVPLYQPIAAAFMVLLFLTAVYFLSDFSSVTNERIVYKYLTDTLYVKTEVAKQTDTLKNTNFTGSSIQNQDLNKSILSVQRNNTPKNHLPVTLCRSIKNDSDLKQFMVSL